MLATQLADFPLFWGVDIGCEADEHVDGSDIVAEYQWPQVFKMWIAALKYLLRGDDQTASFVEHISGWADPADIDRLSGTAEDKLAGALELCVARARGRGAPCEQVYQRCKELLSLTDSTAKQG